jgi:hypothetical protein
MFLVPLSISGMSQLPEVVAAVQAFELFELGKVK